MTTAGNLLVAERYARALIEVAIEKDADLDRIARELKETLSLLEAHGELASVLSTPAIASAKRVAVLQEVLSAADFHAFTLNLLRLLTAKERLPLLGDVITQYQRAVDEHHKVQSGEVASAHPVTKEQQQRLAERLGEVTGRTMLLDYRTEPELVGGLVVRIGNRIYDASVVTQLRKFKEKALASI